MTDVPIACTLTPDDLSRGRDDLLPGLLRDAAGREETEAGYRYRFTTSADVLLRIARVVERERQCCRFFKFGIVADANLGPVWLDVSGPDGTKVFLAELTS